MSVTEPILKRKQTTADQLKKAASDLTPEDLMGAGWSPQDALRAVPTTPAGMQPKTSNLSMGEALAQRASALAAGLAGATMGGAVGTAVGTGVKAGLGVLSGTTTQRPAAKTTDSAPAEPGLMQTRSTAQTPAMQAPQLPAAPSFSYKPSTRTEEQLLAAARARAQLLIGTQRQDAQAAFAEQQTMANQQREDLARRQGAMEELNRSSFAAKGLNSSGFQAGANSLTQAKTVGEIGKVNQQEFNAQKALTDRLAQLNQLQNQSEVANYDQLLAQERQFGLQERAQQYGEFSGNRDYGLRATDLGSILKQRAFDLQRGQALLPGEIQGQSLGNQSAALALSRGQQLLPFEVGQAQLGLQRAQGLLPYELQQAQLGVQGAQLGLQGQTIGNQAAQFNLDSARQMQPIQQQAAQLANERTALTNKMALLDYQIANDPDVGSRQQAIQAKAEAQQKMRLVEAQIAQVNAEAARTRTSADNAGLTAYQQYQAARTAANDEAAAFKNKVNTYTKDYDVTSKAAELWVTLEDLISTPKSDGRFLSYQEVYPVLGAMLQRSGLNDQDAAWLNVIFQSAFGNATARSNLGKYLKGGTNQGLDLGPDPG